MRGAAHRGVQGEGAETIALEEDEVEELREEAASLVLRSPAILEYGEKVRMVPTGCRTWSVDTPDDLARVTRLMENDDLMQRYNRQ